MLDRFVEAPNRILLVSSRLVVFVYMVGSLLLEYVEYWIDPSATCDSCSRYSGKQIMEGSDGKVVQKFQKSYFDVLGLCCSSEVSLVENLLKSMDGVKDFTVIVPTKTVIVVHDNLLISQLQIGN